MVSRENCCGMLPRHTVWLSRPVLMCLQVRNMLNLHRYCQHMCLVIAVTTTYNGLCDSDCARTIGICKT